MKCYDKNGMEIEVGNDVEVPESYANGTDSWNNEFVGMVIEMDSVEGVVTVRDQDGNCFDIDSNRVELL